MINLTGHDGLLVLILLILILGDKITTYLSIYGVQKNYPDKNYNSVEKNIVAKWLLDRFGNVLGNIIMIVVSFIQVMVLLFICKYLLIWWGHVEYLKYVIGVIIFIYLLVIGNNTYYALKFNKII